MVQFNPTRIDLLEKCKKPIEEYNKRMDLDGYFEKLVDFTKELIEEDKQGGSEQLSEEELEIFDILTKPDLNLTTKERAEVKKVARALLQTLKQAKLVLDWRKKLQARADVYSAVKKVLDELPRTYMPEVYQAKCDTVYNHIFEKYQGEGASVYASI